MKFKACLFIIWFGATGLPSFAQTDSAFLNRAANSLSGYFRTHPVEKVYLHLDKSNYLPNDTIWFKAYTVVGDQHKLSALSGVLYCDLIYNGAAVMSHTLKLVNGTANGDFVLSRSLKRGSYHIRAYTNWMRNAGADYFFDQKIQIGGIAFDGVQKKQSSKPDVQFFPEGGDLVSGVRSKVAVKSVNTAGLGEDIKGAVTDNEGNEVAVFETQHLGMGVFALTPQPGKTYKVKITCADSSLFSIDLPEAREEGFTLAVNSMNADSIYIKVAANDKLFNKQENAAFYLVAQSGGRVYYTAGAKLTQPVFTTRIAKNRFPTGIIQFTLFSQNGEPLNERIIFIQHDDQLKLKLSSALQTYSPRQKVKIDMNIKNSGDTTITDGVFSVSVINESRVATDENSESTILSDLLLTADLKGYIEQPNYYFSNISDKTRADLDMLMLTQGYRRFEWRQVLANGALPEVFQPENSLGLAGMIKTISGKTVPNGKITLLATKEGLLLDTVTDKDGNFKFTGIDLPDTAKIVLRATKQHNGSNLFIYVRQPDYPNVKRQKEIEAASDLSSVLSAKIQRTYAGYQQQLKEDSLKNGRQLKGVVIKGSRSPKPDKFNGDGTKEEHIINMKKLQGYLNIKNALHGEVPELFDVFKFNLKEHTFGALDQIPVVINGMPFHLEDVYGYVPDEVESIRLIFDINPHNPPLLVMTTKQYAGTDTTVLKTVTIKTKQITPSNKDIYSSQYNNYMVGSSPGLITYPFKGYYIAREFYKPKYDGSKTETQAPDLRTTIYWNPDLTTHKSGKASFEYFNSDTKGVYRVEVQGIDNNGKLGREVYRYKVE